MRTLRITLTVDEHSLNEHIETKLIDLSKEDDPIIIAEAETGKFIRAMLVRMAEEQMRASTRKSRRTK